MPFHWRRPRMAQRVTVRNTARFAGLAHSVIFEQPLVLLEPNAGLISALYVPEVVTVLQHTARLAARRTGGISPVRAHDYGYLGQSL
jgi:hypothetical protein